MIVRNFNISLIIISFKLNSFQRFTSQCCFNLPLLTKPYLENIMKTKALHLINKHLWNVSIYTFFVLFALSLTSVQAQPGYVAGDFHQHTTFTDGSWTMPHVFEKCEYYGLDWWANSEHGGGFNRDGRNSGADLDTTVYWDQDTTISILGTVSMSGGHQNMWRWQSLSQFSFPLCNGLRAQHPNNLIIQGYEMNVPGHEHGSVAIIGEQFNKNNKNVDALAQFEYMFDNSDRDVTGGLAMGWTKSTASNHEKTLEAAKWLQDNHTYTSWLIPAHPERQRKYTISHFRDMNNIAPDVCFGFESMPGHQKSAGRGGYSTSAFGGTYGGCGYFAARVGGLWDAMLSEGRNYWLFASSDFHDIDDDFYQGEYQKTYTYVTKKNSYPHLLNGLRSGNSWITNGDLIDYLGFTVYEGQKKAEMGQNLALKAESISIVIIVHDPSEPNHNTYSSYNTPTLHHIDLIAGKVKGKIDPASPEYAIDTVATTSVIARFDAVGGVTDANGLTSMQWKNKGNGWYEVTYNIYPVEKDMYYRVRGTNLELGVANETDPNGNPLADALMGANDGAKAFADLWFYSNPIFVTASKKANLKSTEEENFIHPLSGEVSLYPNPASDQVSISNESGENILVTVFDITGKMVKSFASADLVIEMDVTDLEKGNYAVVLKSASTTKTIQLQKK